MKKVGIFYYESRDRGNMAITAFTDYLRGLGAEIRMIEPDRRESAAGLDLAVAFGGDGTILQVVEATSTSAVPILGVNIGKIGFLASAEPGEAIECFNKYLEGDYFIEEKLLLEADVLGIKHIALNDFVLSKGANTRPVVTEVYIDGMLLDGFVSDGIIVSTPTGSTAYSLSAGGPVVGSDVFGVVISPICPHTLYSRPIVLSGHHKITVRAKNPPIKMQAAVDGRLVAELSSESVEIKVSELKQKFIRFKDENFYDRIINKLRGWSAAKE
ncbi:MAG TPA: NAD(+)/NADH kinase [Eubacteriales bacterium]|jgi:NAD+ kinase|nr:NAD(+)/NADH kinase [Clostridia bacterium]HRR90103.1 NAD(+)/NADH kinase [Eubacteriales bacterium]HRU84019.1 NAD(+)/NADH kinase [Eubacteriales bacterium]